MLEDNDFFNVTDSSNYKFVKHNKTDYDSFRNFQDVLNKRYEIVEADKRKEQINNNIKKFNRDVPQRWRDKKLSLNAKNALREHDLSYNDSFYFYGDNDDDKRILSYLIAKKMLKTGLLMPSNIKIFSEEYMLGFARIGYEGNQKFNDLLGKTNKLYIIHDVGSRDTYDADREGLLWDRLIDHVYSNSLQVILCGTNDYQNFYEILSNVGKGKLKSLVGDNVIFLGNQPIIDRNDSFDTVDEKLKYFG